MTQSFILTPATGAGAKGDPRRPAVVAKYNLKTWEDVTAQPAENMPTSPNLYGILVDETDTTLDTIAADSDFRVLWRDTNADGIPTLAELNSIRTWLQSKGFTTTQLATAVGTTVSSRTRKAIAAQARDYMQKLPKG